MIEEMTIEVTDYCPHHCPYCSSNPTDDMNEAEWISMDDIRKQLDGKMYEHIYLSGGEPLAHPNFYEILQLCKEHTNDVVLYTNAITHITFNPNVIDNIYVEANLTLARDVDRIHILKRVKQGWEKTRPEVTFSSNYNPINDECKNCEHMVVKPDGNIYGPPCDKNPSD